MNSGNCFVVGIGGQNIVSCFLVNPSISIIVFLRLSVFLVCLSLFSFALRTKFCKLCKGWYRRSKRQETSAIWKQRKQGLGNKHEFSLSELREQVREIVERKRTMKTTWEAHYRMMCIENFRGEDWRTWLRWKRRNQTGNGQELPTTENLQLRHYKRWIRWRWGECSSEKSKRATGGKNWTTATYNDEKLLNVCKNRSKWKK